MSAQDIPDEFTAKIDAAFRSLATDKRYWDEDILARKMVNNRHSKGAFIGLVRWLLIRIAKLERERDAMREALRLLLEYDEQFNRDIHKTGETDIDPETIFEAARAALAQAGD